MSADAADPQKAFAERRVRRVSAYEIFCTNVHHTLSRTGVSQSKLADITRLNRSNLNEILRGIGNPSIETLQCIADALDMPLFVLLTPPVPEAPKTKTRRIIRYHKRETKSVG